MPALPMPFQQRWNVWFRERTVALEQRALLCEAGLTEEEKPDNGELLARRVIILHQVIAEGLKVLSQKPEKDRYL